MKYALGVSTPEYVDDINAAIVDLTPALLTTLIKRRKLVTRARKADSDLYEVSFWDYSPVFIYAEDVNVDDCTLVTPEITTSLEPPMGGERAVECVQMIVTYEGKIRWTAIVKHTDDTVTTADFVLPKRNRER